MATGQMAQAQTGKSGKKSRVRWFIIGGVALLLVGLTAGAGLWRMQNLPPETGKTLTVNHAESGQALLPVGRITVNVVAAGLLSEKKTRFLLIEPTLLYAQNFDQRTDGPPMATLLPEIRDSFIEFLSQLHEDDIYGSAGLAELRAELLRRARVVTESDAPMSILLQDFVLQ